MGKNAICTTGIGEHFLRFAVTEGHEAKYIQFGRTRLLGAKKHFVPFKSITVSTADLSK